jgi:hypothetical protein
MKNHLLSLILLLGGSAATYSQTQTDYTPNAIPPAPNAASLGKFGDIPVGYYTGLVNTNEYGVVQFPETGNGFSRYSGNGGGDTYELNGVSGQWGDNWINPSTGASLYNTIQQFNRKEPGVMVHYGDISAYDPSINLGHRTHTQGNAIDIHYMGASGQELTGNKAYSKADICITDCFMSKAEANGFSKNYTYGSRFTHSGDNNHSVHKNHLHIGRPNRRR